MHCWWNVLSFRDTELSFLACRANVKMKHDLGKSGRTSCKEPSTLTPNYGEGFQPLARDLRETGNLQKLRTANHE